MTDDEYCPTRGGRIAGYMPQIRHALGEWVNMPISVGALGGVPYPRDTGGVLETIGLCGYAQAHALMWMYAASHAGDGTKIEVRVQEYRIHYDIKAKAVQDDTEPKP